AQLAALDTEQGALKQAHEGFAGLLARQQMDQALKKFDESLLPHLGKMSDLARELVEQQTEQLAVTSKDAESKQSGSRWIIVSLLVLCVGVGAGLVLVVRGITSRLRQLTGEIASCARSVSEASTQIS